MKAVPIFRLIFFGAIFVICTWLMVVGSLRILLRQYHAESFPKTQGEIIAANEITSRGSKGHINYHPAFEYTYAVGGHNYTGHRYRYDGYPSDQASVDQIIFEHSLGSTVDVYYDPDNPADAVLSPRVVAQDSGAFFMSCPASLMALLLLCIIAQDITRPATPAPVAGGVKILPDTMATRVRLPRYQPSLVGLVAASILSFAAGIAMAVSETTSPVFVSIITMLAIIAASVSAYVWQYQKIASGLQDLVINSGSRTVELPATYGRQERWTLPFSTFTAVTVEKILGGRGSPRRYAPTLQLQDGTAERLTNFLNQERAESFAAWLREKLGLPALP